MLPEYGKHAETHRRLGVRFPATCLLLIMWMLTDKAMAGDSVIAPTGTLRAAYIVANRAQGRLDQATGTVSGVVADITKELARRADAASTITPLPTAADVLEAVRSGRADIGFVAPNPERKGVALYSQTYMLVQQSALVNASSLFHSVSELDQPGLEIGANTDDSVGVWLKERLVSARVRTTPDYSLREAVRWLKEGTVVAFAGNRQRLAENTRDVAGLRLLSDNFYGVPQAIAVPLDRADRLHWIDSVIDELRSSGFLAQSMACSGVDGIEVAPSQSR